MKELPLHNLDRLDLEELSCQVGRFDFPKVSNALSGIFDLVQAGIGMKDYLIEIVAISQLPTGPEYGTGE